MNLPKELEPASVATGVRAALEAATAELYPGSQLFIPLLPCTPAVRQALYHAKSAGEVALGYEAIDRILANELHGLRKVENHSQRVSRLILLSRDGSTRFHRQFEFLQRRQGARVLICRLDVDSPSLGSCLGLTDRAVKAVLLIRKNAVVSVLKALL